MHTNTDPSNTAADTSIWITIEKSALEDNDGVTAIWAMADDTTDPDDHPDGDLKDGGSGSTCQVSGPYSSEAECIDKCIGGKCSSATNESIVYWNCTCPVSFFSTAYALRPQGQ